MRLQWARLCLIPYSSTEFRSGAETYTVAGWRGQILGAGFDGLRFLYHQVMALRAAALLYEGRKRRTSLTIAISNLSSSHTGQGFRGQEYL